MSETQTIAAPPADLPPSKTTAFPDDIRKLGDIIAGLAPKDAGALREYLEEQGIEASAGVASFLSVDAPSAHTNAVEEKSAFNVVLKAAGDKKIQVIKVVRQITGLGLKEAKELVESAPATIKESLTKEEAEKYKKEIEAEGGQVEFT